MAKELYDAGRGSFFSFKDLTWDVLGTATGLALSWAVDRLFFQRDGSHLKGGASARVSASQGGGAGPSGGRRPILLLSLGVGGHPKEAPGDGRNTPVVLLVSGGW